MSSQPQEIAVGQLLDIDRLIESYTVVIMYEVRRQKMQEIRHVAFFVTRFLAEQFVNQSKDDCFIVPHVINISAIT